VDLSLAPTDDLVGELVRRHDYGVVAIVREGEHGEGTFTVRRRWFGKEHACVGVAMDLVHYILRGVHDTKEPISDED
jgi:hypothetical protein